MENTNQKVVKTIKRYEILELNKIQGLITDFSLKGIQEETRSSLIKSILYTFYPLTPIHKLENTLIVGYTKFNKPSVVFQESIYYNVPQDKINVIDAKIGNQFTQIRYGLSGICSYYSKVKNQTIVMPCMIFFDSVSCYDFYLSLFEKKKVGFYYFEFFKGKNMIIISDIIDITETESSNQQVIKNMFNQLNVGWIQYDRYSYNEYTLKKMMPNYEFRPKKIYDWELLLDHYVRSCGVLPVNYPNQKVYRQNYTYRQNRNYYQKGTYQRQSYYQQPYQRKSYQEQFNQEQSYQNKNEPIYTSESNSNKDPKAKYNELKNQFVNENSNPSDSFQANDSEVPF